MEITGELLQEACKKARPYIYRLIGSSVADLEDILQTACMKALQHVADFQGKSQFSTWFCTIARNEAFMLHRKRVRLNEESLSKDLRQPATLTSEFDARQLFDILLSNKLNPEEIILAKERTRKTVEGILRLSPKLRSECLLWTAGTHSQADSNTRKARRFHARRKLREVLEAR